MNHKYYKYIKMIYNNENDTKFIFADFRRVLINSEEYNLCCLSCKNWKEIYYRKNENFLCSTFYNRSYSIFEIEDYISVF